MLDYFKGCASAQRVHYFNLVINEQFLQTAVGAGKDPKEIYQNLLVHYNETLPKLADDIKSYKKYYHNRLHILNASNYNSRFVENSQQWMFNVDNDWFIYQLMVKNAYKFFREMYCENPTILNAMQNVRDALLYDTYMQYRVYERLLFTQDLYEELFPSPFELCIYQDLVEKSAFDDEIKMDAKTAIAAWQECLARTSGIRTLIIMCSIGRQEPIFLNSNDFFSDFGRVIHEILNPFVEESQSWMGDKRFYEGFKRGMGLWQEHLTESMMCAHFFQHPIQFLDAIQFYYLKKQDMGLLPIVDPVSNVRLLQRFNDEVDPDFVRLVASRHQDINYWANCYTDTFLELKNPNVFPIRVPNGCLERVTPPGRNNTGNITVWHKNVNKLSSGKSTMIKWNGVEYQMFMQSIEANVLVASKSLYYFCITVFRAGNYFVDGNVPTVGEEELCIDYFCEEQFLEADGKWRKNDREYLNDKRGPGIAPLALLNQWDGLPPWLGIGENGAPPAAEAQNNVPPAPIAALAEAQNNVPPAPITALAGEQNNVPPSPTAASAEAQNNAPPTCTATSPEEKNDIDPFKGVPVWIQDAITSGNITLRESASLGAFRTDAFPSEDALRRINEMHASLNSLDSLLSAAMGHEEPGRSNVTVSVENNAGESPNTLQHCPAGEQGEIHRTKIPSSSLDPSSEQGDVQEESQGGGVEPSSQTSGENRTQQPNREKIEVIFGNGVTTIRNITLGQNVHGGENNQASSPANPAPPPPMSH